jgi:hypothetical protein
LPLELRFAGDQVDPEFLESSIRLDHVTVVAGAGAEQLLQPAGLDLPDRGAGIALDPVVQERAVRPQPLDVDGAGLGVEPQRVTVIQGGVGRVDVGFGADDDDVAAAVDPDPPGRFADPVDDVVLPGGQVDLGRLGAERVVGEVRIGGAQLRTGPMVMVVVGIGSVVVVGTTVVVVVVVAAAVVVVRFGGLFGLGDDG